MLAHPCACTERDEQEEALERATSEHEQEFNNMAKRVEILETLLVDEEQAIQYMQVAQQTFDDFTGRSMPLARQALAQQQQTVHAAACERISAASALLESLLLVADRPEQTRLLAEFRDKIHAPLVADLGSDAAAPWAPELQKLSTRLVGK